jgi:AraC-like DNA-binding protein
MFSFEYIHANYGQMFEAMSAKLKTTPKENWLFFPPDIADGYYRILQLPNGLDVNIINCKINTDWVLHRKCDEKEYYTLRFDELAVPETISIGIDGEVVEKGKETVAVAYLTSSLFDWYYHGTKGTIFKGVNILIPKEWLGKLLGVEVFDDILPTYIALKSKSFNMEPLDKIYKQLIEEIMQEDPKTPFPKMYIVNRVQLLMEHFFTRIHSRVSLADVQTHIKQDDIYTMLQIERLLIEDFAVKPKSIDMLSRKAAMSSTKLKKMFKTVFGLPVYEYYQQKRMNRAGELLSTGKYSVKQVSELVGYSNISNFATAFKKQMKIAPNQFVEA